MVDDLGLSTWLVMAMVAIGIIYLVLEHFLGISVDPKEPPLISSSIPYIGHVIGVLWNGSKYYSTLRAKHPCPIYTLGMLGGKTYVVNSPDLVIAAQRSSKTLIFEPLSSYFAARVSHPSKEAIRILMKNLDGEAGEWGLLIDTLKGMHAALAPGSDLDNMNRAMIQSVSRSLDDLAPRKGSRTINTLEWIRHEIGMASTDAVFGPMNPLRDPEVEAGFWNFEKDLTMILFNIIPKLTARKGLKGCDTLFRALEAYFRNGGHKAASGLTKARYAANAKNGVAVVDIAHFETGIVIAVLANAVPTTFWMLCHIYSDPALLEDLRTELSSVMLLTALKNGTPSRRIDLTKTKNNCPLLVSIYQEVLRTRSFGATVRIVAEDTVLSERYLLKKDAIVQIPSTVLHSDPSVWGANVNYFDGYRFVAGKQKQKHHPAAFRAFGGGTTLCPGRHFATTEILAIVAMFVMRYDLAPVAEGGWRLPKHLTGNLVTSVLPPVEDIKVHVRLREGYEEGEWAFELSESEERFGLSV